MPTIVVASLRAGEGRTTVAAALGACLAERGRPVRLARLRSPEPADAPAEDDARTLASVPGCEAAPAALSEQDALARARETEQSNALLLLEALAGSPKENADKLAARVLLVAAAPDEARLGEVTSSAASLGDALLGVVVTRQPEGRLAAARAALDERRLPCLGVLPEDRLLAGPTVRELAGALRASTLAEGMWAEEAVEHVMLGAISADPGQPYFLQHGSKAVVNRFDRMDLHLAALATEPDCLILTGGQMPSPYLVDRVAGGDGRVTVLLSPENTVRTVELIDDLYGRTRLSGQRKLERAVALARQHLQLDTIDGER